MPVAAQLQRRSKYVPYKYNP